MAERVIEVVAVVGENFGEAIENQSCAPSVFIFAGYLIQASQVGCRSLHVADFVVVHTSFEKTPVWFVFFPPWWLRFVIGVACDFSARSGHFDYSAGRVRRTRVGVSAKGAADHVRILDAPLFQLPLLLAGSAVDAANEIQAGLGWDQVKHLLLCHLHHGFHRLAQAVGLPRIKISAQNGVLGRRNGD